MTHGHGHKPSTDPCSRPPYELPRYFPGQLLTEDELEQEQQYFRDRLRLHNRLLWGWGTVCGAVVCRVPGSGRQHSRPLEGRGQARIPARAVRRRHRDRWRRDRRPPDGRRVGPGRRGDGGVGRRPVVQPRVPAARARPACTSRSATGSASPARCACSRPAAGAPESSASTRGCATGTRSASSTAARRATRATPPAFSACGDNDPRLSPLPGRPVGRAGAGRDRGGRHRGRSRTTARAGASSSPSRFWCALPGRASCGDADLRPTIDDITWTRPDGSAAGKELAPRRGRRGQRERDRLRPGEPDRPRPGARGGRPDVVRHRLHRGRQGGRAPLRPEATRCASSTPQGQSSSSVPTRSASSPAPRAAERHRSRRRRSPRRRHRRGAASAAGRVEGER